MTTLFQKCAYNDVVPYAASYNVVAASGWDSEKADANASKHGVTQLRSSHSSLLMTNFRYRVL